MIRKISQAFKIKLADKQFTYYVVLWLLDRYYHCQDMWTSGGGFVRLRHNNCKCRHKTTWLRLGSKMTWLELNCLPSVFFLFRVIYLADAFVQACNWKVTGSTFIHSHTDGGGWHAKCRPAHQKLVWGSVSFPTTHAAQGNQTSDLPITGRWLYRAAAA